MNSALANINRRVPQRSSLAFGVLAVICGLIVGLAAVTPLILLVIAGSAALLLAWVGIRDWRAAIIGLVVFLPYSGIFILLAYPQTGPATLLKDLLFVIPCYLGFAFAVVYRGQKVRVPGLPVLLLSCLTVLVLIQMFNPSVPNILVGLIGAKVWLMYIPMAVIGYHFVRGTDDLERLLLLFSVTAIFPSLLGIVEGILVNSGNEAIVYSWYGDAAGPATQGFANVGETAASILRVPSTFSFVGQYYLFTVSMIAATYAYWRGFLVKTKTGATVGLVLFAMVALASMLSGARGAILAMPAMLMMMLALDRARLSTWAFAPLVAVASLWAASTLFGTDIAGLLDFILGHAGRQFDLNTTQGFSHAFGLGSPFMGLGTGVDTQSARYALPEHAPFALIGGRVEESWWVKSMIELGVPGMVLAMVTLATIFIRLLRAHSAIVTPSIRAVSSALVTLIAFVLFYNFKGSFLDFDPTNVFFWLFVGMLLKLPEIDRQMSAAASGSPPPTAIDGRSL